MNITDPRVDPELVPSGSRPHIYNGPKREYQDLPSIITPNGYVITRWQPTLAERQKLADGEDIYLTLVCKGVIPPVCVSVGPMNWKK